MQPSTGIYQSTILIWREAKSKILTRTDPLAIIIEKRPNLLAKIDPAIGKTVFAHRGDVPASMAKDEAMARVKQLPQQDSNLGP